jgi:hypothetical protein
MRKEHWSLARRSSIASSLATGLIGWNGFIVIAALALGYDGAPWPLFAAATLAAVIEIATLRALFFPLRMHTSVRAGAIAGAAFGAIAFGVVWALPVALIRAHPILWALAIVYTAAPVGAFLSYFHRDDRAIDARAKGAERYGRDAHWLEPFAFGAVAYALAFGPRTASFATYVVVVGAMSGVVAAGLSHFSPDRWKRRALGWSGALAIGAAQGGVTGLLLRAPALASLAEALAMGALSGVLTYAVTFARGRALAAHEEALR